MTKSISLTIMRTESLLVKLSVTLLDSKEANAVYSIYETDMYDYITVNLIAYIVIQYKPKLNTDTRWDASKSVRVNEMSIFTLIRGLKEFYSRYQRPDLFTYYKSGLIECNATDEDKVVISLVNNQFIELTPDVILDPVSNIALPGVIMKLNNTDNLIKLSSDEFEAFMFRMMNTNIQAESLQLVNIAINATKDGKPMMGNKQPSASQPQPKEPIRQNIFQKREERMKEESVTDKRIQINTPSSINDL